MKHLNKSLTAPFCLLSVLVLLYTNISEIHYLHLPCQRLIVRICQNEDYCRWTIVFQITITRIWNAENNKKLRSREREYSKLSSQQKRLVGPTRRRLEKWPLGWQELLPLPASAWLLPATRRPQRRKTPKNPRPPLWLYIFSPFFCSTWKYESCAPKKVVFFCC